MIMLVPLDTDNKGDRDAGVLRMSPLGQLTFECQGRVENKVQPCPHGAHLSVEETKANMPLDAVTLGRGRYLEREAESRCAAQRL